MTVRTMPPDSGPIFMVDSVGAQRGMHYYNFPYVAALRREGLDVRLLSTAKTAQHALLPAGVPATPSFKGIYGSAPKPVRAANYVASLVRIARLTRKYGASLAHFHFYQVPPADDLLTRWLNRSGVTTVATVHDIVPFAAGDDVRSGRDSTLHQLYRHLSGIIVNSDFALTALGDLDPRLTEKATVIPHGNFTAYARSAAAPQAEARNRLGLPGDDPILLVFGTVKPNKRLDLVLRALTTIADAHPGARLVVAGTPRDTDITAFVELAERLGVADNVLWRLAFIPDEDAPLYFCAADVMIFPYQWIYQSGALLMAMSFGRPVVATTVGSNPEFVDHEQTGLLVPLAATDETDAETVDAFAQSICALLDDPTYAARLGDSAATFAAAELSWDKIAAMTADFYAKVLTTSGDRP
jgi:D-inositol-3-phosphate glycosyltransferase